MGRNRTANSQGLTTIIFTLIINYTQEILKSSNNLPDFEPSNHCECECIISRQALAGVYIHGLVPTTQLNELWVCSIGKHLASEYGHVGAWCVNPFYPYALNGQVNVSACSGFTHLNRDYVSNPTQIGVQDG